MGLKLGHPPKSYICRKQHFWELSSNKATMCRNDVEDGPVYISHLFVCWVENTTFAPDTNFHDQRPRTAIEFETNLIYFSQDRSIYWAENPVFGKKMRVKKQSFRINVAKMQ